MTDVRPRDWDGLHQALETLSGTALFNMLGLIGCSGVRGGRVAAVQGSAGRSAAVGTRTGAGGIPLRCGRHGHWAVTRGDFASGSAGVPRLQAGAHRLIDYWLDDLTHS